MVIPDNPSKYNYSQNTDSANTSGRVYRTDKDRKINPQERREHGKDFKKLVADEAEDKKAQKRKSSSTKRLFDKALDGEDVEVEEDTVDGDQPRKGGSLFDLSKETKKPVKKGAQEQAIAAMPKKAPPDQEEPELKIADVPKKGTQEQATTAMPKKSEPESPSELFGHMRTKEKPIGKPLMSKEQKVEEKPKMKDDEPLVKERGGKEKDITFVAPTERTEAPVGTPITPTAEVAGARTQARVEKIQEIVDQIVNKLYTVQVEGRTDTTIELKGIPQFEGAKVVITEFDTAKGEFNITFENLTNQAKQVLDMQQNQESLKSALEQKGYMVHILTTTTEVETRIAESGASFKDESGREKEEGSGGQKDKEKEEEEEER